MSKPPIESWSEMMYRVTAALLCGLVTSGCVGQLTSDPVDSPRESFDQEPITPPQVGHGDPLTDPPSTPPDDGGPEAGTCEDPASILSQAPLRRLSRNEYVNTLRVLLPEATMEDATPLLGGVADDIVDYKYSPGTFAPSLGSEDVTDPLARRLAVASHVAGHVVSDDTRLRQLGLSCEPQALDRDCAAALVETIGGRILRRELSTEDVDAFMELWSQRDGVAIQNDRDALRVILATLLTDPEFLLHVPSIEEGTLTPGAIASRLAFASWGAAPDEALLEASARGDLADPAQREAHARRLIETPQGRRHVRQMFDRWFAVTREIDLGLSAPLVGLSVEGLNEELREEAMAFVEHVVFEQRGSYQDLMTSPADFPSTDRLAFILGHEASSSEAVASTTGRAGFLARPIMLVHKNERPALIHRAVHAYARVMCGVLPPPPAEANSEADKVLEALGDDVFQMNSRDIAQAMTGGEICGACHNLFNSFGFTSSGFGALGESWAQEQIYGPQGDLVGTAEIDVSVELTLDGASIRVDGMQAFGRAIAESDAGQRCAAQQIFRITHYREPTQADRCHTQRLLGAIARGDALLDIFVQNAAHESILVAPSISSDTER